jgi:hypothetical protein
MKSSRYNYRHPGHTFMVNASFNSFQELEVLLQNRRRRVINRGRLSFNSFQELEVLLQEQASISDGAMISFNSFQELEVLLHGGVQ